MEAVFNVFKKCTIVAILILLSSLSVICQNELQQGDEAFRLFKYEEAIQMYEKHLLNKDDNAVRVKLVDALMFTSQYQKAEVVLEKLLLTHNDGHAMLKYANVLVLNDKKVRHQAYCKIIYDLSHHLMNIKGFLRSCN
ncbi:MAG: tetratricopeptide repeat protein [Saprospiraceae bacterium]|nr:tetratricopeptide repeat protein [Saprospiraceae bacterium]